jgi:microcystin-dependent protein
MQDFIGTIQPWAGVFAPSGWAFCLGQSMLVKPNKPLFSLLGVAYGGDGVNTFKLPNLCGRIPLGMGGGYALGAQGGASALRLTHANLPPHTHEAVVGPSAAQTVAAPAGTLTCTVPATSDYGNTTNPSGATLGNGMDGSYKAYNFTPNATSLMNLSGVGLVVTVHDLPLPTPNVTVTNMAVGGMTAADSMPSYTVINYIICITGWFPSET